MKQFAVKASHSADGPFMNSKQEPGTAVHVDDDTENYQVNQVTNFILLIASKLFLVAR